MKRSVGAVVLLVSTLTSCRHYDFQSNVSKEAGLIPAEQFTRYGREQAQLIAAGRELGHADSAASALAYARGLPDVANVTVDSALTWVTLSFKSGWRVATVPITDGKRGAETAGLPTAP
jgi:hypothetical protein